ncbi:MAG TPA: cyanophycinase [Saprospiraceae bacterium]|nr:cyanophycinase [Saprospiraceae bacterium]
MSELTPKGILIAVGGNEDKGIDQSEQYDLDFVEEGILSHILRESGGRDSEIIIITTASSIPVQVGKNYTKAFNRLGCTKVRVMDIRSTMDIKNSENLKRIANANCVMFSGGDQRKLVNVIGNTDMHELFIHKYYNDPFVIAGTSAGAMAMSSVMISGGVNDTSMLKGNVSIMSGLGFISNVIIDSHFINRGRFGRLTEAVALNPDLIGVGLGEDTGVIIKEGKIANTVGSGMVLLFDGNHLSHNNVAKLNPGTPISIGNLIVHVMARSDCFNLDSRILTILTEAQYNDQEIKMNEESFMNKISQA